MSDIAITNLERNGDYPLPIPIEGATANFLIAGGNILQISMPDIARSEELAIRQGPMRVGIIFDGALILWVFTFGTIILECPFDVRKIPRDLLALPDITTASTRIAVEIHLVDTSTKKLRGLRFVTLSPTLTRTFLEAVQRQIADPRSTKAQEAYYSGMPITELPKRASVEVCGK